MLGASGSGITLGGRGRHRGIGSELEVGRVSAGQGWLQDQARAGCGDGVGRASRASGHERKRGWRWKDEEGVRSELVVEMGEESIRRTPGAS